MVFGSSLLRGGALAIAVITGGVLGAGCEEELPDAQDAGVFLDEAAGSATVQGFVWDAEAYWLAFANCGMQCMLPPLLLPFSPLYQAAAVPNAGVALFDPTQPMNPAAFPAMNLTGSDGGWFITGVPLRPAPPFFPIVGSVQQTGNDAGAPTVGYLPTMTLKPISTANTTLCLSQGANVVSDSGVLEAVAIARTLSGTPTTVGDLVDPTKTGGVVVWWLWMPGAGQLRVPAFGVSTSADQGTTFQIGWAPPGVIPAPIQSKRGFYVSTMPGDMGALPISVTVMPPLQGPPPSVTFTQTDHVTAEDGSRPFTFPSLGALQVGPGVVTFGELQASSPGAGAPPSWVCLP